MHVPACKRKREIVCVCVCVCSRRGRELGVCYDSSTSSMDGHINLINTVVLNEQNVSISFV